MALQGIEHFFRHIALFTHSAALLTAVISTAPERQQWVASRRSELYRLNGGYQMQSRRLTRISDSQNLTGRFHQKRSFKLL
jgi:hypothetical protein